VIGIGNPGKNYDGTRHNIGWAILDRLAERHDWSFRKRTPTSASCGGEWRGTRALLVKPLTYVNLTGKIIAHLLTEMEDPARDLLLVLDEMDLPLGGLRMRSRGRSGGHRGLDSVIGALGTSAFPRLRVGIGRPEMADPKDYVLARFRSEEREAAEAVIERGADAVECWIENGIDMAMNVFNRVP
jgi:PTH1 family peptidyl-tRNA hydrolase